MGVLAITAVWGFRYAMDKQKANQLYNEAKVSYFSASSVSSSDWAKVGFTPLSGYELLSRTDAAGMRFVLAKNIEADVCSLLLDFSQSTDSNGNIATSFSKICNSCPENHYCRLIWTKETWTGSTAPTGFANDYVGDMFGVCVPMSATTGNAQPVYPSSENLMSRKTDCPDGQYCNLRWTTTENNCTNASIPNDYVGLMYGGCIDLNKVNTATCPGSISGVMVP